jgi:hypothetical protein
MLIIIIILLYNLISCTFSIYCVIAMGMTVIKIMPVTIGM